MAVITSADFLNRLANPAMPAGTYQVDVSGVPLVQAVVNAERVGGPPNALDVLDTMNHW